MPILDIEIVGPVPEELRESLSQRLADAAGKALGSGPRGTWVKLRFVEDGAYAENGGGRPGGARPVIVSVLQARPPRGAELAELASELTEAIADACNRPAENIHLVFEPAAEGRISFGGRLRS